MTGQERPQDPVPPGYEDPAGSQDGGTPPFQTYQQYPPGYVPYPPSAGHPGYPAHPYYPPQGMAPPNHLGWAIAALIVFWPVGIPAIIKATQVDRYWMMGQYGMAEQASKSAKTLGVVSLIVAGSLILLWFVLFFVFFGAFVDQIPAPGR